MSDDRVKIGPANTVGDIRRAIGFLSDECPIMVRNAPLPMMYLHLVDGAGHLEFEFPQMHPDDNTWRHKSTDRLCHLPQGAKPGPGDTWEQVYPIVGDPES